MMKFLQVFGNGLENHRSIILIAAIAIMSTIYIIETIKSNRLRKIFNFHKELKKINMDNHYQTNHIPNRQAGTLIGYSGMRPIYVPDDANHVFVCGTTGSGKQYFYPIL